MLDIETSELHYCAGCNRNHLDCPVGLRSNREAVSIFSSQLELSNEHFCLMRLLSRWLQDAEEQPEDRKFRGCDQVPASLSGEGPERCGSVSYRWLRLVW